MRKRNPLQTVSCFDSLSRTTLKFLVLCKRSTLSNFAQWTVSHPRLFVDTICPPLVFDSSVCKTPHMAFHPFIMSCGGMDRTDATTGLRSWEFCVLPSKRLRSANRKRSFAWVERNQDSALLTIQKLMMIGPSRSLQGAFQIES